MQTNNKYQIYSLGLNSNTWKNLTMCKQMISMNRIICNKKKYLQPFNCAQANNEYWI